MIRLTQFDGQYTEADIAAMNEIARSVLEFFAVTDAHFSDKEIAEIRSAVENEVSGRFIDSDMGCAGDYAELMPANWRRFIAAVLARRPEAHS